MLSFFCKIVYSTRLLTLNNFTSAVAQLTLPMHRHVSRICFLLWLFDLLILSDIDSMHFVTFRLLPVKHLHLKIDFG